MQASDDTTYRTMAHKVTVNGKPCNYTYTVATKSDKITWSGVTVAHTNKRKYISEISGNYVIGNKYTIVIEYHTKEILTLEDGTELHYNTMTTTYECERQHDKFAVLVESTVYSHKEDYPLYTPF